MRDPERRQPDPHGSVRDGRAVHFAGLILCLVALIAAGRLEAHILEGGVLAGVEVKISIADEAVRYDLHIPLADFMTDIAGVETWADFQALDPAERDRRMAEHFFAASPLEIDGVRVRPRPLSFELQVPKKEDLPPGVTDERMYRDYSAAVFALDFATKGAPRRVRIVWQLFPYVDPAARAFGRDNVAAELLAYGKKRLIVLSREEPEFTWHAETRARAGATDPPGASPAGGERSAGSPVLPLAPILLLGAAATLLAFGSRRGGGAAGTPRRRRLAGAGLAFGLAGAAAWFGRIGFVELALPDAPARAPTTEEAALLFESLHRNIYRAFDYTEDGAIYDALAESVDGPLLESIYTEIYESLVLREEGGAVSSVQAVEVLDASLPDGAPTAEGFRVRCRWRVQGLVKHWGHTHERTNEFEAIYGVAPRSGAWRIIRAEILGQKRVLSSG